MATKPTQDPKWVTSDDPLHIIEPTTPIKTNGIVAGGIWGREHLNWMFNSISKWIDWVRSYAMDKDNNLSDVANTTTAFNNIKQVASTTVTGVVEQATGAEITAGTISKFPDAAGVKTAYLQKADNLSNVASAATSFNNIKQVASTTATGVVEQATAAEVTAGTAGKFPDAAGIKVDYLTKTDNLSSLVNKATSRTNLGTNDAVNLTAGTVPVARLPAATTSANGVVEKATAAETTAGTADKYPSAAEVKTAYLQKADNLSNVASAVTSFSNIKQAATTTTTGVVEKATNAELTAGTADKFPDSASVATLFLSKADNLASVANTATARSNLGTNDAANLTAGTIPVARLPTASTTTNGVVEQATAAEMTAGTASKFPDAATVKAHVTTATTGVLINSNNLSDVSSAASARGNLNVDEKGTSGTQVRNNTQNDAQFIQVANAATTGEMTAGTASKFPDAAKVKTYVEAGFVPLAPAVTGFTKASTYYAKDTSPFHEVYNTTSGGAGKFVGPTGSVGGTDIWDDLDDLPAGTVAIELAVTTTLTGDPDDTYLTTVSVGPSAAEDWPVLQAGLTIDITDTTTRIDHIRGAGESLVRLDANNRFYLDFNSQTGSATATTRILVSLKGFWV